MQGCMLLLFYFGQNKFLLKDSPALNVFNKLTRINGKASLLINGIILICL